MEEKKCPSCSAGMECKLTDLALSSYGRVLLSDVYEVDLYACPKCGKVELYTANFRPKA